MPTCTTNYTDIAFGCTNTTYVDSNGDADGVTVFVARDCESNSRLPFTQQDVRYSGVTNYMPILANFELTAGHDRTIRSRNHQAIVMEWGYSSDAPWTSTNQYTGGPCYSAQYCAKEYRLLPSTSSIRQLVIPPALTFLRLDLRMSLAIECSMRFMSLAYCRCMAYSTYFNISAAERERTNP